MLCSNCFSSSEEDGCARSVGAGTSFSVRFAHIAPKPACLEQKKGRQVVEAAPVMERPRRRLVVPDPGQDLAHGRPRTIRLRVLKATAPEGARAGLPVRGILEQSGVIPLRT